MMLIFFFHIIHFILSIEEGEEGEELIQGISSPIIFSFDIINTTKKELNNITIDSSSAYIFSNNISIIKNLSLNGENNSTLISTNLSDSVFFIKKENKDNEEDEPIDILCPIESLRLTINNNKFIFETCGPYNISLSQSDNEIIHEMYQIIEVKKSNSIIEYDSIFALPSLKNVSMVVLDYIDKNIKIYGDDKDNEALVNQTKNDMVIKCEQTGSPFSCKVSHLLFGMEGEENDPFLANDIQDKNSRAFFDNLSSYHIFPHYCLNYILTSFFSKYNDECQENQIKGTELYYITCSKKKIEIFSYERNMSVIINNFAFPLKNLFNESFRLLEVSSPQIIYFNILFNESSNDFIFGSDFFMGKRIGYDFINKSTYIYSKDFIDYRETFSDINNETFTKLLYILTLGLFSCFLIASAIMTCLHTRQVNKELENMLK